MTRRVTAFLLSLVFVLFVACKAKKNEEKQPEKPKKSATTVTKVTEYEFFAVNMAGQNGFNSAASVGLVAEEGYATLEKSGAVKRFYIGSDIKSGFYRHTWLENKNTDAPFDNYNRGYDLYIRTNEYEFYFLRNTDVLCYYKRINGTGVATEKISSIVYKSIVDTFLYYTMPKDFKDEYKYSFKMEDDSLFVATYTRMIGSYKTDDVLKVTVYPWGEVESFEGFGRNKYERQQNSVTEDMIKKAEEALNKKIAELKINDNASEPIIVTDNKGELYLKKQVSFSNGGKLCNDEVFIKIAADKLQMTDTYIEMDGSYRCR